MKPKTLLNGGTLSMHLLHLDLGGRSGAHDLGKSTKNKDNVQQVSNPVM